MKAYHIKIQGLVQGVGFRPFIYRLAKRYSIHGWVKNTSENVIIQAEGQKEGLIKFLEAIEQEAPEAANIDGLNIHKTSIENFKKFEIIKSSNISDRITEISPDIAICKDCLKELKTQNHRINYPFINCTNCGPRFTIIKNLPYDRDQTTMNNFEMCNMCRNEYENIDDRRFHAQPIACNNCGPEYELDVSRTIYSDFNNMLLKTTQLLEKGKILALKGLGGFHLACDATNAFTVKKLRESKLREGKPFAVMFRDIETLKEYTNISKEEEKILLSWKRPIVILKSKKPLAYNIGVGFDTIGAILPYMPFHYLLFEKLSLPAIVLTSGNISDEPILIDNKLAKSKLDGIYNAILTYNRDIYNRTDDSVAIVVNNSERLIRRSRGYAPVPVKLDINLEGILATGAELVNCFCIGKENQAILSQHIGDLKNYETYEFYTQTIERFKNLFRFNPKLIACDMHPDYLSTTYASELGLPIVKIQHHHAHIASCMAENTIDEKVIGVSFDGTGYGDDGNIWGGEFLFCDLNNYERYTHFNYIPLPGGDSVTKEPWRTGLSYLYSIYGYELFDINIPFIQNLDIEKSKLLIKAIDKKINSPLSSSAGRLFDAVAAIINLCPESKFHAEAPMRLENIITENVNDEYKFSLNKTVDFKCTIKGIIDDIIHKIPTGIIAAKFHNTIISVIFATVSEMSKQSGIKTVALSGGTFQNKYISENIENRLLESDFKIAIQKKIPANDGGIAIGQLAIAAKRRELKCV